MTRTSTKRCLFLSMSGLESYVCDDDLAMEALEQSGVEVKTADWRTLKQWDEFDWAIVRSTWDYQSALHEFFTLLAAIDASPTKLANPLSVMNSNKDKRYLLEMQRAGVPIVPTKIVKSPTVADLRSFLADAGPDGMVVKPVVSAGAERTHWLVRGSAASDLEIAAKDLAGHIVLQQPFLPAIQTEGEYSVFYFNGDYSHTTIKQPKSGDFRVQEEHGGVITGVVPDPDLVTAAGHALATLEATPLYARVDLVRGEEGFLLMELELIEPSLYFSCDKDSATKFTAACHAYFA